MDENEKAARTGGGIAKNARLELEDKTGRAVVSAENYLPPTSSQPKALKGKRRKGATDGTGG